MASSVPPPALTRALVDALPAGVQPLGRLLYDPGMPPCGGPSRPLTFNFKFDAVFYPENANVVVVAPQCRRRRAP
ncbi:hypothetical protein EYF80_006340 [Liparis tanakae]|uniref:Uncharacterized protein n=1 Tax=Liparis tanakae TaxID=230148 RepID=A0A4Z2IZD4_9TELE|nr:hypothetical protein EYF80_006340 [Liparis tanakae]